MRKKWKLFTILSMFLIFTLFPINTFASSQNQLDLSKANILLETTNPEIGIAFFIPDEIETYAYQSKSKTGSGYFYKTADGSKIADFECTGTFSYDGSICNVTEVATSVWGTIDGYRVDVSKSKSQISPTYARATGVFQLYSGSKMTSAATINVYCNQNGTTNVEFNSDND